jgi:Arc/MetJ-type ribon-helix-helix transcriptional regulator
MTRKRPYVTVTLPPELLEYLNGKIESREFMNLSHGIELCILRFKQAEESGVRP